MFLKRLQLNHYRNYAALELDFQTAITILVGDNAQGKSNLLESIYFLATTKSLKADADFELISYGQDFTRVAGEVQSSENCQLDIAMQLQGDNLVKQVKVNGLPRRIFDYIGHLYVVAFSPEDINLVTGPPAIRRWHIDLTLSQVDRNYKKALTQYGDVVARKNKVLKGLKEGSAHIDELTYWADQQIIFGQLVSSKRRQFFDYLNTCEQNFPSLTETLEYQYLENSITKDRLLDYQDKEIWNATSLIGPHRDDFRFLSRNSLNQIRDLSRFGSRGEQRTAVLDLKISEASFVENVSGARPVLLLDDVFSELDEKHRQHVIKLLTRQQTILATVELDPRLKEELTEATFYAVENGQIRLITGK